MCVTQNIYIQVTSLVLTNQDFTYIPANSFAKFLNLKNVDVSESKVDSIEEFAFDTNIKLKSFVASSNMLSHVPSLYRSQGPLKTLTMRNNQIISLDLSNFENLILLDIDYNLIDDANLYWALLTLPNLRYLSVNGNKLQHITKEMFAQQPNLTDLSLRNNQITRIDPASLDSLLKLTSVDLKENQFQEYRTEGWHFCHDINEGNLDFGLDDKATIGKNLKKDLTTESYCEQKISKDNILTNCKNVEGHLTCYGSIENILCDLFETDFKSVTFPFMKDMLENEVENFYQAETNSYFREINGKPNMTAYLSDLTLYGTKFDLSSLDDYVGYRTEKVTIQADTVFMRAPLKNPLTFKLNIRARIVSITEDIYMNMTRQQLFDETLPADQPVDNWALVEEKIIDVGNTSFSNRKQGFVEIQQVYTENLRSGKCSPGIFTVDQYQAEHGTDPEVFFDFVLMNLMRVAVRTLTNTRSNDHLALTIADHVISKTADKDIVADKQAYRVAQKLIRDKEVLLSDTKNVPFYTTDTIKDLAKIMFDQMSLYLRNETDINSKLDIALGRMADMNKHFEDAKLLREMYFQLELETLNEIWNSTDGAWHWNFNASRNMENEIQDSIQKNGEEMFEMQENELKEMLARAQDTVVSDQAVVDNYKAEFDRYSEEATMSLTLQRTLNNNTKTAGDIVDKENEAFNSAIDAWKTAQMLKALFGFLVALGGLVTMQPEIAGPAIAEGAAMAAEEGAAIEETMTALVEVLKALKAMEDMLNEISGVGDIDINIPDFNFELGLAAGVDWREALENAYYMKNMTQNFKEVANLGATEIEHVGVATSNAVDPSKLHNAMLNFCDSGTQLVEETVNFAKIMMHLADIAGDLQVAEKDLEIAIEQVQRVEQMLEDLQQQHDEYIDSMNERREEYEGKCDDFAEDYQTASDAAKEAYKEEITKLFEQFKQAFEESNAAYIKRMNALSGSLYEKAASVKQHSMVQRSLMMNLFQDYCDAEFYVYFAECDTPTMSDDFGAILSALTDLQWDAITSLENLPSVPEKFENVSLHSFRK